MALWYRKQIGFNELLYGAGKQIPRRNLRVSSVGVLVG